MVRYPTEKSSQKDWDFVLIDSANDDSLARAQQKTFELHTTLHLKRGTMDEPDPTAMSTVPSANFIRHRSIQQDELECGFRMILHMYLAGRCRNASHLCRTINKLRGMDSEILAQKCRNWVCDMLRNPKGKQPIPDWIARLIPERSRKER